MRGASASLPAVLSSGGTIVKSFLVRRLAYLFFLGIGSNERKDFIRWRLVGLPHVVNRSRAAVISTKLLLTRSSNFWLNAGMNTSRKRIELPPEAEPARDFFEQLVAFYEARISALEEQVRDLTEQVRRLTTRNSSIPTRSAHTHAKRSKK